MDKLNIVKDKHQKVFFISDLHFGHKNILNFCQRPFTDIKDMELKMISYWNAVVSNNDIVFVLGDTFWFNDRKAMKRIFKQLNGKQIYLILGNHCDPNTYERLKTEEIIGDRIQVLSDVVTLYLREYNSSTPETPTPLGEIVLSHYPLMTWSHRDKGAINLFGHIHSGPRTLCAVDQDLPLWKGKQYDVGADNNNYTPVEYNRILAKLKEDLQ